MIEHTRITPPPPAPSVLFKAKSLYSRWLKIYKKIGKPERFGAGDKIDRLFIEFLELLHSMRFSSGQNKILFIEKAINKIDKIKFFSEIIWENKLINTGEYSIFIKELEEIGRILGGWKKGMINKNSQS